MKITNYNDGYIRVYKEKNKESDFGARKNIKSIDDLEFIVKLAYKECNKRQQDLDFAEARNRSLSLKIKTRFYRYISNYDKVIIKNVLYDIVYFDIDREKQEIYFYLEEVRKIA